jgi:hypothetical protein
MLSLALINADKKRRIVGSGVMEYWSDGVMEYWSDGVLEISIEERDTDLDL